MYFAVLRKKGKVSYKAELYPASLWGFKHYGMATAAERYRVRIDGKWIDTQQDKGRQYFTKWEFRDMLFRSSMFRFL